MSRKRQSEADQRRELGGYSEAEFDAEFVRSQRSDLVSVIVRVLSLVIVYGLVARAILAHDLPPWLLVLPFAVEFLTIFWVGWLLSRFVVSCEVFAKSAGSFGLVVLWSLVLGGGMLAAMIFNPGGTAQPDSSVGGLREAGSWIVRTDLHWALLTMVLVLLGSTYQEVMRWKQIRGVFVWTSIMTAGFRIGVAFLLGFAGVFIAMFAGDLFVDLADVRVCGGGTVLNWLLFAFIVIVEIATLVISVWMHRDAMKTNTQTAASKRGVLP